MTKKTTDAENEQQYMYIAMGSLYGVVAGMILGLLIFDNIGIGIALGAAVGAAMGLAYREFARTKKK